MGFSFETSLVEQMNEQHINNMNWRIIAKLIAMSTTNSDTNNGIFFWGIMNNYSKYMLSHFHY